MDFSSLTAVSPIDGRYAKHTVALRSLFSEYALIRNRIKVEVEWFISLADNPQISEVPELNDDDKDALRKVYLDFNMDDAKNVKNIESTTNHDVKAVEYHIKAALENNAALKPHLEFIHFCCTSEDINNIAYALMLKDSLRDLINPKFHELDKTLSKLSHEFAHVPMMSRTHGQPATPTTVGKELANILYRLRLQLNHLENFTLMAKKNGAVGNYNAHFIAYPDVNWVEHNCRFIESLNLEPNIFTTQIEPHDNIAELFHLLQRIHTICIDGCRDIWQYIAMNYFKQKLVENEVGSSTMPHKVNPIDFENAEGNFGLANAVFQHLAEKLPVSRMQRDLSDSTVMRNIGVGFAYQLIACNSMIKGLGKLDLNPEAISQDLNNNWALLGEAIQTVMKRYGIKNAYEKLKDLTRGKELSEEVYLQFVDSIEIPAEAKERLKQLKPSTYTGVARDLTLWLKP